MKTTVCLLPILFLIAIPCHAQDFKIKYGQIPQEYLDMKLYEPDPQADAVVLSKVGYVRYDINKEEFALTEQRHTVIKLFTPAGIEKFGNVILPYYSHNNYSRIGNIRGLVHLPDGTEVKLENEQIFDEETNDFYSAKKFAFPQLVPGAIIEYQYNIISDAMFEPVDWFFQSEIPIIYSELTTQIPEYFEYVILTQGNELDKKTRELVRLGTDNISFVNYEFVNEDVPALKRECCITTMEDYFTRVRFRLNAVQPLYSIKTTVFNTWPKLAKELWEDSEWGGQIKNEKSGEFVLATAGINPSTAPDQMDIAKKLYNYINQNIQWNQIESFGWSKTIPEILKEKSATNGNLNKLLWAGLSQAGIQVTPVLISTRDHGKVLELYPFVDQFNHLILLATIDGKEMWMDAGDKNVPIGVLQSNSMNARGWAVHEKDPAWIDVLPVDSKSTYFIKGILDGEGSFTGTMEARYTGYHAVEHRTSIEKSKDEFGQKLLSAGSSILMLQNKEIMNTADVSLPLQVKADIDHHSIGTATTDKIYLSAILPKTLVENPFKLEARTYPIDMNYPEEFIVIINMGIPEGFRVESVPVPVRYVTENKFVMVSYAAEETTGKLNITMKYSLKQLQFEPEEYITLKTIYNQREQKFNEQIVLTKI